MAQSTAEIRDRMLRGIRNSFIAAGISNPNTAYGSDNYVVCNAIAEQQYAIMESMQQNSDNLLIGNLNGKRLDDELNKYGLTRKSSSSASGYITVTLAYNNILIPIDSQLTSVDNGQVYRVVTDTIVTFANPIIRIQAIESGQNGNLDIDKKLRFQSPPSGINTSAVTSTSISGGSDVESDESAQQRLIDYLRNPATSGNVGDVINVCKNANPLISDVWVYPCINGPASCHVAIAQNSNNLVSRARSITDQNVIAVCQSELQNKLPLYAEYFVTSINELATSISLELISNLFADDIPFPTRHANGADISALTQCSVLSVDGNSITFKSTVNPLGSTDKFKIAFVNSDYQYSETDVTVITSTLTGVSPNQYYLVNATMQKNIGVFAGGWVFPAIVNGQEIVDEIVNYISKLSPAEKTESPYLLERASMQPLTNPNVIDYRLAKQLETTFDGIYEVNFLNFPSIPLEMTPWPNVWTAPNYFYVHYIGLYADSNSYRYS